MRTTLIVEPVLAVVVEEQRLGAALALVVAGRGADRVDVAPVALRLRVHGRVAVDLGGRGLQDRAPSRLARPSMLIDPVHGGLGRLHGVALVVHRRGRARQVVDLIHLDVERDRHVVPHQLEARIVEQVVRCCLRDAGEEVVDQSTSRPRSSRRLHRWDPMKPDPPVTKVRLSPMTTESINIPSTGNQ